MNRIVLIGNGFDLAHRLPTKYEDFINWYWEQRVRNFNGNLSNTDTDCLCSFKIKDNNDCRVWNVFFFYYCQRYINPVPGISIINSIMSDTEHYETVLSPFLRNICNSIENKGWVDIENEYYQLLKKCSIHADSLYFTSKELNTQLRHLQDKLIQYLTSVTNNNIVFNENIKKIIYSPINLNDISVAGHSCVAEHCSYWLSRDEREWRNRLLQYDMNVLLTMEDIAAFKRKYTVQKPEGNIIVTNYHACPSQILLPNYVMILNFNYSTVADRYTKNSVGFVNHIHGDLSNPQNIIFGYGDELDEEYSTLLKLNDNECLQNIKSIKYLESDNYRGMLSFIESEPYQVYIMGHSCGNSDRTLLNTLFEHKNCVSIKPFYHQKDDGTDNYLEIIQNICRNFTDMKLMRDKVVNKTYCEPLPQNHKQQI